jgi:hypothetical protein
MKQTRFPHERPIVWYPGGVKIRRMGFMYGVPVWSYEPLDRLKPTWINNIGANWVMWAQETIKAMNVHKP